MDDVEARINELESELYRLGFAVSPMTTVEQLMAGQRREAEIKRELQALRRPLPQMELAEIGGRRLSTGELERPTRAEEDDDIRGDPMLRHLRETGQSW